MTALFTANEIVDVTRGRNLRPSDSDRPGRLVFTLDDITPGDWFVALSFGTTDSHDYLCEAIEKGAQGCIVNRRRRYSLAPSSGALISVPDTELALLELAEYWRGGADRKVVTVTGTVGRKETIRLLEFLLAREFRCHVALDHGELGCLPDLLSMPAETDLLIVEVSGANRGDVARTGSYLKPDIAIITSSHHPLPSPTRDSQMAALQCEILDALDEGEGGTAIVFDHNPAVAEKARSMSGGLRMIHYSRESLNLSRTGLTWLSESCSLSRNGHTEANAWCAVQAAVELGFSLDENPHIVSEVIVNAGSHMG